MYVRGAQTFIHPSTKRKRHFLDPMFSKPSVMAMYIRLRGCAGRSQNGARGANNSLPVIEHSSRRVGVSPEYWLIMPFEAATGTGMVSVIGLWNFLLRGSTVTIGDTATRFPSNFAVSSVGIGWAW